MVVPLMPRDTMTSFGELRRTIEERERRITELESALTVILKTTRGDKHSECWTIREWLDARGIYNGDISGPKRLTATVCKHVLGVEK